MLLRRRPYIHILPDIAYVLVSTKAKSIYTGCLPWSRDTNATNAFHHVFVTLNSTPPASPPPPVTCSFTLTAVGAAATAPDGTAPGPSSPHGGCWVSSTGAPASVRVSFGDSLRPFAASFTGVYEDASQPSGRTSTSTTGQQQGSGAPDWGLTLLGVTDLLLLHTAVADAPLSAGGPLLQCRGCGRVTLRNVTIARLQPPPPSSDPQQGGSSNASFDLETLHGPVGLSGITGPAVLESVLCEDVTNASGWACVYVLFSAASGGQQQAPAAAKLEIRDSTFQRTSVTRPSKRGASLSFTDGTAAGSGAVAVASTDSSLEASVHVVTSTFQGNTGGTGGGLMASHTLGPVRTLACTATSG